ncbi:MAG: endonuclease/exonuclease/phosphatase family protein [Dysgonomonas sp.]
MKNSLLPILLLIMPFWLLGQQNHFPQENNTYRIMSYNIRNAKGLDNKTDYQRIASIIESISPDIAVLQEIDSITERSNKIDVLKELADLTAMYRIFAPSIHYQGGKYGIGILSRERPLSWKNIALPGREEPRTLLMAEFESFIVFATHLSLNEEDRLTSINTITEQASQYQKPIILAGDLNAKPESDVIKSLSANWKIISNIKNPTHPADKPSITIDYIAGYKANGKTYSIHQSRILDEPVASDHRPLFADVRLKTDMNKVMRTKPYLQNPSTDGMTIMWHTNVPCRSWVEYGTDTTNMRRVRTFIEGEAMANNTVNRIRIENLIPGTKYYYRAISQEITLYQPYSKEFGDTVRTPIYSFTTWDNNNKDFTALIFNDIHDNYSLFDKLYAQVKDTAYDVVFFNGDCIADVQSEAIAVRSISHYIGGVDGSNIPTIFIRGNHETRGAYSMFLWNLLEKKGGAHTYGAFNIGDTRFVLLDCGEDKPDDHWVYYDMNDFTQYRLDQAEFLKKEITSNEFKKAKKRVLIHHIPIYGEHLDKYRPCKDLWEPILSKAKFNISLNAHTHRFEYISIGKNKNIYPVIIGGGNDEKSATVSVLQKKGDKMTIKVLNANGNILLELDL